MIHGDPQAQHAFESATALADTLRQLAENARASVRGLRHESLRRKSSHCLYWLLALAYQRRELINYQKR